MCTLTLNLVTHYTKDGECKLGYEMFKSLVSQTDHDFTLNIIINNHNFNKKGVDPLIRDLKRSLRSVNVIPIDEVRDLSYARNIGIKNVHTDYFTQLDSDDYISLDYVEKIKSGVSKSHGGLFKIGVVEHYKDHDRYFPYIDRFFFQYDYDYMFNAGYVFPKKMVDELGFQYPEGTNRKIEDQLAYLKFFLDPRSPREVYFINEYLYHYIKSEDSFQYENRDEGDPLIPIYFRSLCPLINVNYV